jgi:cytochrome P450
MCPGGIQHPDSRPSASRVLRCRPFNHDLRFRPVQERYPDLIERIAGELVDGFAELGPIDLRASFARVLPIRVSAAVLGLSGEDTAAFGNWYDDFGRALSNYEHDPVVDKRARVSNEALRRRVLGRPALCGAGFNHRSCLRSA